MALRKPPQVREQRQEVSQEGTRPRRHREQGSGSLGPFPWSPRLSSRVAGTLVGGAPRGRAGKGPLGARACGPQRPEGEAGRLWTIHKLSVTSSQVDSMWERGSEIC